MPRAKKISQLDGKVKIIKKRKTFETRKSKNIVTNIVTKDMIAKAAYLKAVQHNFESDHEELDDWREAGRELSMM